jgi:SAM-dependent methyltransferase
MLSGDVKLTVSQKIWWLWINFVAGISGYASGRKAQYWHSKTLHDGSESPSRKEINSFLKENIPVLFPQKRISVLDVGCGTGYVYMLFTQLGYSLDYTGLDVQKRTAFDRNVPEGHFVLSTIENFQTDVRYDLVISNTCLEHVQDDITGVQRALALGDVQIHIIPTFWSLPLYLWHGYRQYTPRSLLTLFGTQGTIYRLGGVFSFLLHFFAVTIPQRVRVPMLLRRYRWYSSVCRAADSLDRLLPWMSVMYVVVIRKS